MYLLPHPVHLEILPTIKQRLNGENSSAIGGTGAGCGCGEGVGMYGKCQS